MPSFTSQTPNLQTVGPLVEIQVTVGMAVEQAFRSANTPTPAPVSALAMIDTGSTSNVIRQGMAAQLSLNPIGITYISTPSSTNVPCYEYLVRILFPNKVVVETTVLEAPLQGQHIQCLIGRDVLAHGVFVYIGYGNLFSLSF